MTDEQTALTERKAQVPDLVRTPAFEIGAEDVAFPRLKIGQYMSEVVQDGIVPAGALFTSLTSDDPDPQVICEPESDEGLVIHVLSLTRGKSYSAGGELVLYDYNDPDAPADAWVTYNYVIAVPEVDQDVPYKWLLTRTARPAAQQINLVLAKNAGKCPPYELAFEVKTARRENDKGKFFVPRVRHVEATKEGIEVATSLSAMLSGTAIDDPSPAESEPAI